MANELYEDYQSDGLRFVFVVTESPSGAAATAEYCRSVREQYGLTMTVVMDPDGRVEALYGANDTFVVTDEDARIVYTRRYPRHSDVIQVLEDELATGPASR